MPQTRLTPEQITSPVYQEFLRCARKLQATAGIRRRADGTMEQPCIKCGVDSPQKRKVIRQGGAREEHICEKCHNALTKCPRCNSSNYDGLFGVVYDEKECREEHSRPTPAAGYENMCQECSKGVGQPCARCHNFFVSKMLKDNEGRVVCPTCHEAYTARFCRMPRSQDNWAQSEPVTSQKFDLIGSRRRFGIELEVNDCVDYSQLKGKTKFGAKNDGTAGVMKEFVSPILQGNAGYEEVERFLAEAATRKWKVTSQCGYHLHIDLSSTTEPKLKQVAIGYLLSYDLWGRMVHARRRKNHFCKAHGTDYKSVLDGGFSEITRYTQGSGGGRYTWANWSAYHSHSTLEIRLHSGTLNFTKVMNWVKMHLRFTDWCCEHQASTIIKTLDDKDDKNGVKILERMTDAGVFDVELANYARLRSLKFGRPFYETDTLESLKDEKLEEMESSVE